MIITDTDIGLMVQCAGLLLALLAGAGFAMWRTKFWLYSLALSLALVIVAVSVVVDLGAGA